MLPNQELKIEKYPFDRQIENNRIKMAVLETAEEKGSRKRQVQIAMLCLKDGFSHDLIVKLTDLLLSEVQLLAEGKDIDAEDDLS